MKFAKNEFVVRVQKTEDKLFYGWVIVLVGVIVGAILIGSRQSFGVFFKSIESDFGLSRAVTSGIFSVNMAFSAVFAALGGWALDKFGPKWTVAAMGFFTGVSLIISSQIHSVWWLYLTYSFIMAMGTGEAYTVVVGFVSRWFQRKRGLALGISTTGGGIGSLIFAPFASYLIVSFDWRIGYIVMGIIALVIVISAAMLLKGYPREMGLLPDGIAADTNAKAVGARKEVKTRGFSLKEAIKTRQFWLMFMIWAFHAIAVYVITTHIVPYATDVGISHIAAATVISVMSVFNIVGGLTAGALSDAFGRKPVSIVSALLGAGSLFWLMWMPTDIWVLFVIAALFGIPFGSIATIVSAMAADIFGTYRIGAIMGVIGIAWFVGATIGPIIGGVIFDINQSYFLAFLVAAICMLIIILFLFMLSKPDSSTSSESNAENK